MNKPIAWTIAGSDSGGGAGMQADLLTFHQFGVHGCTIVTCITAQNSQGVKAIENVSPVMLRQQWQALANDLPAKAIKVGVLTHHQTIATLAELLANAQGKIVVDPVMVASSGDLFLANDTLALLAKHILPYADILTPNTIEASALTGITIDRQEKMPLAAEQLLAMGAKSVLIKGGHQQQKDFAQDYWTDGQQAFWLTSPRQAHPHSHGTGCALSSAIAACLAKDIPIKDAIVLGKMLINQGLRDPVIAGKGPGTLSHQGFPQAAQDLPWVTLTDEAGRQRPSFPSCGQTPLGFYPIVDHSLWLKKLLPLGVTTLQLRIKQQPLHIIEREIKASVAIAKHYQARLFINDYWELAIQHGAYGVHLGQEDLDQADSNAIANAGLRLGISTHSEYELARAHALKPSYIALGPIFPTTSKTMAFSPQGISTLKRWRNMVSCPLVAIGGIQQANIDHVINTGVDSIAVISAVTQAHDPLEATRWFLSKTLPHLFKQQNSI